MGYFERAPGFRVVERVDGMIAGGSLVFGRLAWLVGSWGRMRWRLWTSGVEMR